MCGINGFNFHNDETLVKMNNRVSHRGPDDCGKYVDDGWSLGQTRLSILDLSKKGHQPMHSADGRYTIVFNGEVYNFANIRKELKTAGYTFQSGTDTEVVLYAFIHWGESCLQRFNGMFALAILHNPTGDVFLARDRVGIKPLYYYHHKKQFIFSSEVKAILLHDIEKTLDIDSLNIYFRMLYVPSPRTMWKHIHKLPPAHYAWVKQGHLTITSYWQPHTTSKLCSDYTQTKANIKELLTDSVRLRLIADRPVGVFLSGGIDSTIIAGIASEQSPKIDTFSVGFESSEESEKYNMDMLVARKTAKHFGTTHHEYLLSANNVADQLENVAYHMDEPISNHVQAVNLLLAKKVKDQVTVALGGDGGDELFGGYERYYLSRQIDKMQRVKALYDNALVKQVFAKMGKQTMHAMLKSDPGVDRYLAFFAQKDSEINRFLRSAYRVPNVTKDVYAAQYFTSRSEQGFVRDFMRADVMSWLPDESLARSDKMSMAVGLEERVPFLDHRLVELADQIPIAWKLGSKSPLAMLRPGSAPYAGKQILRDAMQDYLPQFVLDQRKWGWFSPAAKWLRGPLKSFAYEVLSPSYNRGTADMFDFDEIQTMLDKHIDKSAYALVPLWSIMSFQLWYRQYME